MLAYEQIVTDFEATKHDDKYIEDFRPWGSNSICAWFNDGSIEKIKSCDGHIVRQHITEEDVKRHYRRE